MMTQVSYPQPLQGAETASESSRSGAGGTSAGSLHYYDYNATAPLLPEAKAAWLDAVERFIGNPSSPHRLGSRADAALENARERLAAFLGCAPIDLIWTSGATESNNSVLHHAAQLAGNEGEVWVSAMEHPCVLAAAAYYFPGRARLIPATPGGTADLNWIEIELQKNRPTLVAVMAANNETGVLQPWQEVGNLCRTHGIPFFCDAAQWIGKMPAQELGHCDFVSGCAHKFGGPKGVGFLKCKSRFQPLLLGGHQERGRRAGTENVASILSMMAALERCDEWLRAGEYQVRLGWRNEFEQTITKVLPGLEIVGASQPRLWNTVSALMPEADCRQRWVVKLDKAGFAVSTGSACASGREKPSHVLAAMGYAPAASSRMLRFSVGWQTGPEAWRILADGLASVNAGMRKLSSIDSFADRGKSA